MMAVVRNSHFFGETVGPDVGDWERILAVADLDDFLGLSAGLPAAPSNKRANRAWENCGEVTYQEPVERRAGSTPHFNDWETEMASHMTTDSSWPDVFLSSVPPLEVSPIPDFPLDVLDEQPLPLHEAITPVEADYRWLEDELGVTLTSSWERPMAEQGLSNEAVAGGITPHHPIPLGGSSGASSLQLVSGECRGQDEASSDSGFASELPLPFYAEDMWRNGATIMEEGSTMPRDLKEESSEDSASSRGKEDDSLASRGPSTLGGRSAEGGNLGWALDLKRGASQQCHPYVREFDQDFTSSQKLRVNNVEPVQRRMLSLWSDLEGNTTGSHPYFDLSFPGESFKSSCPDGCHCPACDMPKFDFHIPGAAVSHGLGSLAEKTLHSKPLLVNASAAGSKRPDMSARLAALVAANTTKPSTRPAILDYEDKQPTNTILLAERSSSLRNEQELGGFARSRSRNGRARRSARRTAADGTVRPANPKADIRLFTDTLLRQDDGHVSESLLKKQLIAFAEAIAMDDQPRVKFLMGVLRVVANPTGDHMQRLTSYFLDALVARSQGTAAERFNTPPTESQQTLRKAMEEFFASLPYIEFSTEAVNGAIFDAVAGEKAVHIVDFGVWQGGQWPTLLEKLAEQPGGPPNLRITAIECPNQGHPGKSGSSAVGKHLMKTAAQLGIPFEYAVVEFSIEKMHGNLLGIRGGEALAISCCMRLRNLYDGSVVRCNPRDMVLQAMRSLKPRVVAISEMDVDNNGFFFMARFKEALSYFGQVLESHDASFPQSSTTPHIIERNIFARDILNVIACEGLQRVIRCERLEQWQGRLHKAGFQPIPMSSRTVASLQPLLKRCAKGFSVEDRSGALTLNWKDQSLLAASAWKPLF